MSQRDAAGRMVGQSMINTKHGTNGRLQPNETVEQFDTRMSWSPEAQARTAQSSRASAEFNVMLIMAFIKIMVWLWKLAGRLWKYKAVRVAAAFFVVLSFVMYSFGENSDQGKNVPHRNLSKGRGTGHC